MSAEEIALQLRPDEVAVDAGDQIPDRPVLSGDGSKVEDRPQSLDELRAERWIAARAYRNARQEGGCVVPLGRVDTDADSQRKISGGALAALIAKSGSQPFTIDWTMADNSVVAHDASAMIAMGMAVTAYLAACQQAGTAVRAEINAASTPDDIAAIDIMAGYPAA